jgi:hypothetical protein
MVQHGFRRLHKFVFQRFLSLICYKQLRIDINSNRVFNPFLLPRLCFCVLVSRYSKNVYIFSTVVLHLKQWIVKGNFTV